MDEILNTEITKPKKKYNTKKASHTVEPDIIKPDAIDTPDSNFVKTRGRANCYLVRQQPSIISVKRNISIVFD